MGSAVPDRDLGDKRGRGRSSRRLDKVGGGGGGVFKKIFFRPFGPQFGLKISWGPGHAGPLPWSAFAQFSRLFSLSMLKMAFRLRG